MKTPLSNLACLLALAGAPLIASAQDPPKPKADLPFKATLLFLKNDWSKVPAAKEIDADLRAALKDAAVPKEAFDNLPLSGPYVLFAHRMVSLYRAEQFAELAAWLKERGLIERETTFQAAPHDPALVERSAAAAKAPAGSRAVATQEFDIADMPIGTPQGVVSQPFVERTTGFQWNVICEDKDATIRVVRLLSVAERPRGQQEFENKAALDDCRFEFSGMPGGVAVANAFPSESDGMFNRAMDQKGHFAVLVVELGPPAAAVKPAQPRVALPESVSFFSVRHRNSLAWIGGFGSPGGASSATRGSGGRGSRGAPPAATTARPTNDSALDPTSGPAADQERLVVISLKHTRVESALPIIKQLLPPSARIVGDPERQQLFVSGSQADIEKVNEIVGQIDKPAQPAATTTEPYSYNPSTAGPTKTEAYRSDLIRQLQSQFLLPAQRPGWPLKTDLQRQNEAAEEEAQAAAQHWRQLTAKSGDVQTSVEIRAARQKLQAAVGKAFDARQKLQQAELLDMQRRIYSLAGTIDSREKLKEQIIDRRVQELLNPALNWNPPAATSAATTTTKGATLPQYPLRQYPATGTLQGAPAKAAPAHGVIFQVRGDLVDVSLGSDDGIAAGQTLHVFRGNEYVAELEVLVTQLDRLVARIKRKLSSLRPDDRVSKKEPVQAADDSSAGSIPSEAGRPLSDAVREFNAANADNPLSKDQPPLTDDEVVAAIRWTAREPKALGLQGADLQELESIAETRMLPPQARLDLQTDFNLPDPVAVRGPQLTKWTIHIILPGRQGAPPHSNLIREQYIRSGRPSSRDSTLIAEWTPLTPAIDAFNERNRRQSIGKVQPPLTKDEVLTAIRVWLTRREKLPVTNAEIRELEKIAATEQLPPGAELEVLTSFQPDDQWQFEAWSVRLRVSHGADGGRGGGSYAYTIRDRWLKARRIGERKISWGPESSNGMQVGLWLDPPSEVYTKGQQVVPHFFFRNSSVVEQGISLPRIMTKSYYEAIQVSDDKGAEIKIDQGLDPGGPVGWTQLPFTPGAMHEVVGLPIVLGQVKRPPGVETVICAAEGQECRLRFSVDDYLDKDSNEKPMTGEVRFRLAGE